MTHTKILANFTIDELATSAGEFNMDIRLLLGIQALRSYLGYPLYVPPGGGCRHWSNRSENSAHNIEYMKDEGSYVRLVTIPTTGIDLFAKGKTTWELMDEAEKFFDGEIAHAWHDLKKVVGELVPDFWESKPFGRGCYPDTNNNCIHLDWGQYSLNPVIRGKREQVVRWVRVDDKKHGIKLGYHYNETFEYFKHTLK